MDRASSTDQAVEYLRLHQYTLLITEMGRDQDPIAGIEMLQAIQRDFMHLSAIVSCSSNAAAVYGQQFKTNGALFCTAGAVSLLAAIFEVIEGTTDDIKG
ncbi:MAG TPA: hypothetical protein VIB79_03905 [Candidatus Binatia bacterium]